MKTIIGAVYSIVLTVAMSLCVSCDSRDYTNDKQGILVGVLGKKEHNGYVYLSITLRQPIIVNNKKVIEVQIAGLNDSQWIEAKKKIGHTIWLKGIIGPSETQYHFLDALIVVTEIRYY